MKYVYICTRCGIRHEFDSVPKMAMPPVFLCGECEGEGRNRGVIVDDDQLKLFLSENPNDVKYRQ